MKLIGAAITSAGVLLASASIPVQAEGLGGLGKMAATLGGGDVKTTMLDAALSKAGISDEVAGKVKPLVEGALEKAQELAADGEMTEAAKSAWAAHAGDTQSALGELLSSDKTSAVMDLIKSQLPAGL